MGSSGGELGVIILNIILLVKYDSIGSNCAMFSREFSGSYELNDVIAGENV